MRPPNDIDPRAAAAAIAVFRGATSYAEISQTVGFASIGTIGLWVRLAEEAGLITVARHKTTGHVLPGTIRSSVGVAAHSPEILHAEAP